MPIVRPIETPRLVLRGWHDADIEPWVHMNADPRVMEFYPAVQTRAESESSALGMRTRLERDGYGWWVVEIKGEARFGGVIALQPVPFDAPFTPALEVGWRFPYANWGHGFATEGATAALEFAFERLHRDEVIAVTSTLNLRSQRVMQRLGMTRDPREDFDNPRVAEGHRLRPHVLYRTARADAGR